MKRWLKWFGIGLAAVIAASVLLVLSGYLLPATVELELEQYVHAQPETLFALFTTYDGLEQWWRQAALDMGDDLQITHLGGLRQGVGMQVGFGATGQPVFERWTYTSVDSPHRVEVDVDFQIFVSHRVLELTPEGDGTSIHWRETARVDSPVWRWMLKLGRASALENRRTVLMAAGTAASAGP